MSTPNTGIPYVPEGTLDPAAGLNLSLDVIDALLQTAVISMSETAPPGSPAGGALYIPAAPATGAWAGHENDLARYVTAGAFWQFYEAGTQVRLVINRADDGLYFFDQSSSPGGWQPITASGANLTLQDTDSPPTVVVDNAAVIIVGDGLTLTEVSAGVAMLERAATATFAPVVNTAAANVDADETNAGNYTRFTDAAPTYTFNDAAPFVIGAEYHGRYEGAGVLTITEAGTMTVNPPTAGTLEIPPGGTFTVKIVAADEADLFGVTVPL